MIRILVTACKKSKIVKVCKDQWHIKRRLVFDGSEAFQSIAKTSLSIIFKNDSEKEKIEDFIN